MEKIIKCFEDIPLLMENAEEILNIFYDNKRLGDHIWTFYDALLVGVPQLISILLHRSDEKCKYSIVAAAALPFIRVVG